MAGDAQSRRRASNKTRRAAPRAKRSTRARRGCKRRGCVHSPAPRPPRDHVLVPPTRPTGDQPGAFVQAPAETEMGNRLTCDEGECRQRDRARAGKGKERVEGKFAASRCGFFCGLGVCACWCWIMAWAAVIYDGGFSRGNGGRGAAGGAPRAAPTARGPARAQHLRRKRGRGGEWGRGDRRAGTGRV